MVSLLTLCFLSRTSQYLISYFFSFSSYFHSFFASLSFPISCWVMCTLYKYPEYRAVGTGKADTISNPFQITGTEYAQHIASCPFPTLILRPSHGPKRSDCWNEWIPRQFSRPAFSREISRGLLRMYEENSVSFRKTLSRKFFIIYMLGVVYELDYQDARDFFCGLLSPFLIEKSPCQK